jgi:carbonic anhydrase/acetyltransferase-like protein (isoleucine patch superfamily)
VLRGDNESIIVGEGSNVQEGAVFHTDPGFPLTVGKGCTIGHRAILHGCSLGDHVLIGMGATIMNGAQIGSHSIVGAGALVTENKIFPERSLIVGAPAKAIRALDDAALVGLHRSAEHYVQVWQRFDRGLRRID